MGSRAASRTLGTAYLTGDPLPRDTEQGTDWLKSATDEEDVDAMYIIGRASIFDGAVAQDIEAGPLWPGSAAATGSLSAQRILDELDSVRANAPEVSAEFGDQDTLS